MKNILFYNGDIITMNKEKCEAVLVKQGIIDATGKYEELIKLCDDYTEYIDLEGLTLCPSFIDAHSHITQLANSLRFVSLKQCRNYEEIKEYILLYKKKMNISDDAWLVGFGYDHNRLEEGTHPDKSVLDDISTTNPILISHASGHMGAANTMALKKAGINSNTENPAGGVIGRKKGSNEPNGYLEEKAFMSMSKVIEPVTMEEMLNLLDKAQQIYISYGITTAQDGKMQEMELELLKEASRQKRLIIDVVGYADLKNNPEMIKNNREYEKYKNRFRLGGYKIFLDGSPQGKTAWFTKPYIGDKDYSGYPIYKDKEVKEFVDFAQNSQKQLLIHCNGDAAIDQLLKAYGGYNPYRNVIIHAQFLRKDQLLKVKNIGLIPSYFVGHIYYWGDTHIKNLGEQRAFNISPVKSTVNEDIIYTLHQDTPVIMPDMLETVWCAVNRRTENNVVLSEDESIEPREALKGITINAAYQYFEENKKGSISVGKAADFVILSSSPEKIDRKRIKEIKVISVYKEGRNIYKNISENKETM